MDIRLKYEVAEPFDRGLMQSRGIQDIPSFLHPGEELLQSPFDLDNVNDAAKLLERKQMTKTLMLVDSDADGFCSGSIIYQYLNKMYPAWLVEVALHEGKQHGMEGLVHRYNLEEYDLVIIPDAGSNDDEYFEEYPNTDFLVIDHHIREIEEDVPSNVVLVNNQTSEKYKNKSLSGGGVAWQVCRAIDKLNGTNYAEDYIGLAAISIISDIMDTTVLENRYIISTGLKRLGNDFLVGLRSDASFQLGDGPLTPIGVAFYMVPNINAMCRMGTMEEKERMWLAFVEPDTPVESKKRGAPAGTMVPVVTEAVRESRNVKARQRNRQTKMADLCEKTIIEGDLLSNKILTIVLDETFDDMPSELNGLTATKISKEKGRPTMIGRVNKHGELKGSIRGLETIDMPPFKTFLESSGLFDWVQGR